MKYYLSLVLLFGLFNLTFAQDSCETSKLAKHGLQFQIGTLLHLTNFENYTFSYRYRFSTSSGIRVGLYTSINKDDNDIVQRSDTITANPPTYTHYYNIKISVQYLHSLMKYRSFSLILGGGPFFYYEKRELKDYFLGVNYTDNHEDKRKTTGFGVDLILGVEYTLSDNIILSGEYGLSVSKESTDVDYLSSQTYTDPAQNRLWKQNGTIDSFTIRGLGVNLGISVFF